MTTIAQHFHELAMHASTNAKGRITDEDWLFIISAGEYSYEKRHDGRDIRFAALRQHCRDWIREHGAQAYQQYATEWALMDYAKNELRKHGQCVRPGWIRTLYTLAGLAWPHMDEARRATENGQTAALVGPVGKEAL